MIQKLVRYAELFNEIEFDILAEQLEISRKILRNIIFEHYNTNEFIQIKKNFSEFNFNLSELIIPFSKMFKSHKPVDIYSGGERIPFKERDPEFKMILKQEFSEF
ncbi:hypothetical protein ES705_21178 [subsurface metagenome]